MINPGARFGAIVCDPPWRFKAWSGERELPTSATYAHYETMELDELAKVPVKKWAADDCALFMWVVDSHFDQALELGRRWGFGFKSCAFIWVKSRNEGVSPNLGMGHWTRKGAEQCWLFTRGKPKRLSGGVEQLIFCPRGAHSAKPEHQYERIEALVGGPYLEVFGRVTRPGWSAWGDQVGIRDGSLL